MRNMKSASGKKRSFATQQPYTRMDGGFEALLGKRVLLEGNNGGIWSSKSHPYECIVPTDERDSDAFTMG